MVVNALTEYSAAAARNATRLHLEASLLLQHQHFARAYFLAIASIEELGKAVTLHDAKGRSLSDPGVVARVMTNITSHSQKISSAFVPYLTELSQEPEPSQRLQYILSLMVDLGRGREASMYTEVIEATSLVHEPCVEVRATAANDCVRLAGDLLEQTASYLAAPPVTRSRADDQWYTTRRKDSLAVFNTSDWWWFYISELENGRRNMSDAFIQYRDRYWSKGKTFQAPSSQPSA